MHTSLIGVLWLLSWLVAVSEAEDFDADLANSFIDAKRSPDDVFKQAQSEKKPVMVLVTQPWCGACNGLKKQVNAGSATKDMMAKFLVVNAVGDEGNAWKKVAGSEASYVPQSYFFSSGGQHLDIPGPNPDYRHFFSGDAELASAMTDAHKQNPALVCSVATLKDCNEKETKFVGKWKIASAADVAKELERLERQSKEGQIKKDQKVWLRQRVAILKQLQNKDEL